MLWIARVAAMVLAFASLGSADAFAQSYDVLEQSFANMPMSGVGMKRAEDYANEMVRTSGSSPDQHMGKPSTVFGPIILTSSSASAGLILYGATVANNTSARDMCFYGIGGLNISDGTYRSPLRGDPFYKQTLLIPAGSWRIIYRGVYNVGSTLDPGQGRTLQLHPFHIAAVWPADPTGTVAQRCGRPPFPDYGNWKLYATVASGRNLISTQTITELNAPKLAAMVSATNARWQSIPVSHLTLKFGREMVGLSSISVGTCKTTIMMANGRRITANLGSGIIMTAPDTLIPGIEFSDDPAVVVRLSGGTQTEANTIKEIWEAYDKMADLCGVP